VYVAFARKNSEYRRSGLPVAAWDEVIVWELENNASPAWLGKQDAVWAWPRLWAIGARTVLDHPLLGLFGSSRCPGDLILRTYDLARALRDAGVPVIRGFHSPMEAECLDLLLRGRQPVVVCPARGIEGMRMPAEWKSPIEQGRLLVLSPFPSRYRRPTVPLAEERNRLVAALARTIFVAQAAPGSKTEALCRKLKEEKRPVWTFECAATVPLQSLGARCFASVQAIVNEFKLQGDLGGSTPQGGGGGEAKRLE
jgi:predicted Rossmann fold nucleotide-binding protein DprA/Smf involved in DNA uptake